MAKKKTKDTLLYVQILQAKPNKMFTEEQRASIRFLRYNKFVACAECGKKKRTLWTMLCQFRATTFDARSPFCLPEGDKSHPPLTPVCQDHPLAIDWGLNETG